MKDFKKDETAADLDLKFDSDSDRDEDHNELMNYLNPLQLIDANGNALPHSFCDDLKTEGYIYEQFYIKNV